MKKVQALEISASLAGYEVYRFGSNELTGHGANERIEKFFRRLLKKHGMT